MYEEEGLRGLWKIASNTLSRGKKEKGNGGGNNDSSNVSEQAAQGGSPTCSMSGQGREKISSLLVPV